ncbi:MAG: ATP-binding protein [Clostridia bacterium]|nr:ATP-binding protein [Clostridia bacterium]
MSRGIHNLIKNEYERRQKTAFDNMMARKSEVYSSIPRIQEIDHEIQLSGIRYNKAILLGNGSAGTVVNELAVKIDDLKHEKALILSQYKYPANYLEMSYSCERCRDTGFIDSSYGSEKCSCYKQQLVNLLYSRSNLRLTEKENFACFDESYYPEKPDEAKYGIKTSPRENILAIKERCHRFIESFGSPDERNLFFSGPTGVGKTFMSNCIAMELINKGRTVLYQTAPVLFNTITEYKMKAYKEDEFEDEGYNSIFDAELLIIDDLGTETPSAARYSELLNILNTRYTNNLTKPCKTIISTNIGAKKLYEYYTERVTSRIVGYFDRLMFAGEDIRGIKR